MDVPSRPPTNRTVAVFSILGLVTAGTVGWIALWDHHPNADQEVHVMKSELRQAMNTVREPAIPLGDGAMAAAEGSHLFVRRAFKPTIKRPAWTITQHTVQAGETFWVLAGIYQTDISTLQALNPEIHPEALQPGHQVKAIQGFRGVAIRTKKGDTLDGVAVAYGISRESISEASGLEVNAPLQPDTLLFLPGVRPRVPVVSRGPHTRRPPAAREDRSEPIAAPADGSWIWPIENGQLFSEFGYREDGFHRGLDIAVPAGTTARATASGTVVFAGWEGGYGYTVLLDHQNGVKTRYAHALKVLVSAGQQVAQGDPVIQVGSTGKSTGPHLHLEFIVKGQPVDPRLYLPAAQ